MNHELIVDVIKEKRMQCIASLQAQKEEAFRSAIEKHLGEFTEESLKKCTLSYDGGIERLSIEGRIICEVYPIQSSPAGDGEYRINLTQQCKIF